MKKITYIYIIYVRIDHRVNSLIDLLFYNPSTIINKFHFIYYNHFILMFSLKLKILKKLFKKKRIRLIINKYNKIFLIYQNNLNFERKRFIIKLIVLYYKLIFIIFKRRFINKTHFY